ncbi:MAG: DUF2950 family protein [Pseudomonadota bacterium]
MFKSFAFGASAFGWAIFAAGSVLAEPAKYPTPQDALDAFLSGLVEGDTAAMLAVFGEEAEEVLSSGNPDRDALNRLEILALYEEGFRMRPLGEEDGGGLEVLFGVEGWPFPIPLTRSADGWHFDLDRGTEEILVRRIGLNELDAIETLEVYVDIQAEYRLIDHDDDGVMEFAGSFLSSEDARDGLFWAAEDSPLGELIALASLDGYHDGDEDQEPEPFGGYYYRILQSQTDQAPGGAVEYMVNGNMVAGHALLAVPSDYGDTGIHTFMVGENGIVYEADLGEDSLDIAFEMQAFDPDEQWQPVELETN